MYVAVCNCGWSSKPCGRGPAKLYADMHNVTKQGLPGPPHHAQVVYATDTNTQPEPNTTTTMTNDIRTIETLIAADVPVILEGAPGTGKTATLNALAVTAGAHLETLIGSTMDPTDLGYLVPDGPELRTIPPGWATRIRAALDNNQPAWLFLDEITCAPPSVMAALLRVVQERQVGDISIDGCRVVLACNPPEIAAAGHELPAPFANRCASIDWQVDRTAWLNGFRQEWGENDPILSTDTGSEIRELVARYLTSHPDDLLAMPDNEQQSGAWPSPRSWTAFARALTTLTQKHHRTVRTATQSPTALHLANSIIGRGHGSQFIAWVADQDMPDPLAMINAPDKLPADAARRGKALEAMAHHAQEDTDLRAKVWDIISNERPDVAMKAAKVLAKWHQDNDTPPPDCAVELANRISGVNSDDEDKAA